MASKDTIIIIAICAALAALVIVFVLARFIKRRSVSSNPLPPVQPLAREREYQLAKLDGPLPRSQTWYSQNHLHPFGSNSPRHSRTSLLAKSSPSLSTEDSSSYSPLDYNHSLPRPNPSFHPSRTGSSSSLGSSDPAQPQPPPFSTTPPLEPPVIPRTRSSSSSSSPARRSRPMSVSSSHSTIYSKTSRHNLRGVPHGPHSQIQIVLPAPLASDLPGSGSADLSSQHRISRFDGEPFDRRSIVDRWVSTSSITDPPPVDSVPASTGMMTNPRKLQRVASAPLLVPSKASSSVPPVPSMPLMYTEAMISEMGEVDRDGIQRL